MPIDPGSGDIEIPQPGVGGALEGRKSAAKFGLCGGWKALALMVLKRR